MLETWSSEPDDWDVEELSDSQLIDILYEVRCCEIAGRDLWTNATLGSEPRKFHVLFSTTTAQLKA